MLILQVLSEDGKKIKRKQLFTERDKEELQVSNGKYILHYFFFISMQFIGIFVFFFSSSKSRTVVVENLPEDYSRQNLEKIFSVAGW